MTTGRGKYDKVAVEMFRSRYSPGMDVVTFTREELLECAAGLGVRIKNPGDFPYYYSKRQPLPESIRIAGFQALVIVTKSTYAFTKETDVISVPEDLPEIEVLLALPASVRRHVSNDEQGMLLRAREAHIFSDLLDEKVYHIQSHLRTESKELGQVEIDDVYVTEDTMRICTVEAVEPNAWLTRSQIKRQIAGACIRFKVRPTQVVPLAVKILDKMRVVVLLLDQEGSVRQGRIYRFKELGKQIDGPTSRVAR